MSIKNAKQTHFTKILNSSIFLFILKILEDNNYDLNEIIALTLKIEQALNFNCNSYQWMYIFES